MDTETIMNEVSQSEKDKYHVTCVGSKNMVQINLQDTSRVTDVEKKS